MVNVNALDGNSFMALASPSVSARIRAWLFFSFFLLFGAIIAAVWIMADGFVNSKLEEASNFNSFPGTAMMLQTLCIFISAMILMWNRAVASSDYDAF